MRLAGLSLEQAPPPSAPLRFFITAPFHLLLAGALMLLSAPQIFVTRWAPETLALTHLVILGFIVQTMLGAVLQVLPVVAGATVTRPRGVATITHVGLNLGTLALAAGLWTLQPRLLQLAAALLTLGIGTIIVAGAAALLRAQGTPSPTRAGLCLAFIGLALTVTLGVLLVLALSGMRTASLPPLLSAHIAWGFIGWLLTLVAAVAYQVVPMFQTTPPYPRPLSRALLPALFVGLVLRSAAAWSGLSATPIAAIDCALAALVITFAAGTLWLQHRRLRRLRDATVMFWQLAMVCLAAAALLWLAGVYYAPLADDPRYVLALGVLMLGGFALSVINGMLYKIVPFLVWFHLQARAPGRSPVRSMQDVIAAGAAMRHFIMHLLTCLLLCGAVLLPTLLVYPAAAMTMVCAAWLARNLLLAARKLRGAA